MLWKSALFTLVLVAGASAGAFAQDTQDPETTRVPEEQVMDLAETAMLDLQTTWQQLLPEAYQPTSVVLYRDTLEGSCGDTTSLAGGPFYCSSDASTYMDLGFVHDLKSAFPTVADFGEAYIVGHEMGHHIQKLLGAQGAASDLELQADCYAGVWAAVASQAGRADQGLIQLDPAQADDALNAVAATGNARFSVMSTGAVAPETFTHAAPEQRAASFHAGFDGGVAACSIQSTAR
ncbi:MAG TPA: neutral zinc metallopeptidase [Vicinamibacterales bacterium]|nr:neutral zinc metallopeptidase [Vicinamibacterales bacterium]